MASMTYRGSAAVFPLEDQHPWEGALYRNEAHAGDNERE